MTKDLGHVSPDAKRRNLLIGGVAATLTTTVASAAGKQSGPGTTAQMSSAGHTGDVIRTRDGVSLYFKDWGAKDGQLG
jgi:non-heme chloroperoxidase